METWSTIKGFDNHKVSTTGRVMNIKTGKILSPFTTKNGYQTIALSECGKSHKKYVHRIVAEAFIPNEYSKLQVNHLNGNKRDNRVENLEWCTSSENHLHRSRVLGIKRSSEHMYTMCNLAKVTHYRPVVCVETNVVFDCVVDAAKSVSRKPCSLVDVLKGRHETCAGFHWKYFKEICIK